MTGKRTVDQFMHYLRYEKRYSSHTLLAYRCDLKQFKSYLVDQYQIEDWNSVQYINIRSWIFELAERNLEKKTINRKISSLRSFYQFLKKEGLVPKNPVKPIQKIKTSIRLPEVIPEEVLKNYFHSSNQDTWTDIRDHMLIELLYETGMRRSELMDLEWKDVDRSAGYVRVMGKRQKQRQIPLRPGLVEEMTKYRRATALEFNDVPDFVIVTDKGGKVYPKWIYNKVRSILSIWTNSLHLSPHILRHSIATHLLDAGADIQIIREFLGHSALAATEIYTHNSIGKLKKAYSQALPDLDAIH